MELYLIKPDGDYQDWRNLDNTLWSANQAQITAWAQSRGYTVYADPESDPDPATLTLGNLDQVQTWIVNQVSATAADATDAMTTPSTAPPTSTSTPAASTSPPWGTVAAIVVATGAAFALLAALRR